MDIETERVHTFKGNFINGFRHGAGVVENYEGKTKKGTWIQGTYYDFKDDEPIYFGDRKESGLFHGQGTLVSSDGSTAVGEWKDNQLYSGVRTFYNDGVIITNNTEEGIVMAEYQMSWPNTQWYVGETKNDKLNGNFPQSLLGWVSLEELNVSNNEITGNIPLDLGKLEKIKLINLSFNYFSGEIPIDLLGNESLELLYLHVNDFKGFLSDNYCNRVNEMKFLFYGNSICPPYPNCLKYIGKQDCKD